VKKYREKFESLDRNLYMNPYLEISNYIFGGIRSIGILVSKEIQGEVVTYYLDSIKRYHRNGKLKFLQVDNSEGEPIYSMTFDRRGNVLMKCQYSYKGTTPFLLNANSHNELECYMIRYSKGQRISEGKGSKQNKF
jgi:hypothetical protein